MIRQYFKSSKAFNRCLYLHPITLLILWDMWFYCFKNNLKFCITETATTLEEDNEVNRISSTHRTGRAFDLRNSSWDLSEIKSFENFFNEKYRHFGAIDPHGIRHLIVSKLHGTGPHFHVQIDKIFSLDLNLSKASSKPNEGPN